MGARGAIQPHAAIKWQPKQGLIVFTQKPVRISAPRRGRFHPWSRVTTFRCRSLGINPSARLEPAMPGQSAWHTMLRHLRFKGLLGSAGSNCHFVVVQITEEEERPISSSSSSGFNVYQNAPRCVFNQGSLQPPPRTPRLYSLVWSLCFKFPI